MFLWSIPGGYAMEIYYAAKTELQPQRGHVVVKMQYIS